MKTAVRRANERGFATLLSFWMLVILMMMAVFHGFWMYQEIPLTLAYVNDVRARALAWSALNIAAGALLADIAADSDLGVVVTEVMMFGENRADIRINEVSNVFGPSDSEVAIYNNSDFEQDITGWGIVNLTNGDSTWWKQPDWIGSATLSSRTETGIPAAITIAANHTLVLVTDAGDTIDTVIIRDLPPAGQSWQVLPDGSNGEFWTTWPRPAGSVPELGGESIVGWVRKPTTWAKPNGDGEWILPLSVVWNQATGESYVFQYGVKATDGNTQAYWVPADSYFIITDGAPTRGAFNASFDLGGGKGAAIPPGAFFSNSKSALRSNYDDSAALARPPGGSSFLFPLDPRKKGLDLYFFRPKGFSYRFHTDSFPIMYPTLTSADLSPSPGSLVATNPYLYGRITSRMSPYWRHFVHENGDTQRIADAPSRAARPKASSPFDTPAFLPDTYWNWMVPGDSSTLISKRGLFNPPNAPPDDWKDTFMAFSPFDNHAVAPNTAAWASLDTNIRQYGTFNDWDTYSTISFGLNISEVYNAPASGAKDTDFVEFYSSGHDGSSIVGPHTGTRYGGGLTVRDHAYEYIELKNTSNVTLSMAGKAFVIRDTSTGAAITTRYVRPWRAGGQDTIPAGGCAVILPVGADTHVLKIPAQAVLLGLSPNPTSGPATDTQLAATRPLRNAGEYFSIENPKDGSSWHLNFWAKGIRRGRPWHKGNLGFADMTASPGTISNWTDGEPSPGICPGNVDHLLEAWATLTRNTTTGENEWVQFGPDPGSYVRIWVYDESGRLAFNQGDVNLLTAADAVGAFSASPQLTASATKSDVLDTYVTPMDLFYLQPSGASGNPVTASTLKNFTVYADSRVNINTADQYATWGASDPNAVDIRVLRAVIKDVFPSFTATQVTDHARKIIKYRHGTSKRDSVEPMNGAGGNRVVLADADIEQYLVDAGFTAANAATLAGSGRLTVRSSGYFTVVGEGRVSTGGETDGIQTFWAVFERSWTGRPSPTAKSLMGSWRYWRDRWHENIDISNEGGIINP